MAVGEGEGQGEAAGVDTEDGNVEGGGRWVWRCGWKHG